MTNFEPTYFEELDISKENYEDFTVNSSYLEELNLEENYEEDFTINLSYLKQLDLEENYKEEFTISPIVLESAQALLHDDESENSNLDKIESDSYNELLLGLDDERNIEIKKKASPMGEKPGQEILYSCSEVKNNKNQLENPSSYKDYFEALPTAIHNFF
ncbi:822_t:CDS:2 [Scutellospora calospora]|uniref:822_t:CDS:1 n=1 Tax=Scutellospora calospora TaxID=85575 RepID=A0ACA9L269_9GLOM|nr:822_t:CDS:2 [Scutellospora calospora]